MTPATQTLWESSQVLFNSYLREELGYESDLPYEILSSRVHPWDYGRFTNRYVETAENLRQTLTTNPSLKVHVSSGYYDLATPYFATEYIHSILSVYILASTKTSPSTTTKLAT